MSKTIVSSQAELLKALKSATGGETIVLADGDYGSIYLSKKFDSPVRIVSENEQGATFKNMVFYGIDNLSLDSITTTGTIKVERNSANVSITNSQLGNAVMFRDTSNVTVENNDISAGNFGLVLNFAKGFTVRNNVIHGATEDLMRIVGGSNNATRGGEKSTPPPISFSFSVSTIRPRITS